MAEEIGIVKIIKLVTGEKILGEVLSVTEAWVRVKNPTSFYLIYNDDGSASEAIRPYSDFTSDEILNLKQEHIISLQNVTDAVKTFYTVFITYCKITNNYVKKANYSIEHTTLLYTDAIQNYVANSIVTSSARNETEKELYNMESPSKSLN
jgi:hypothetical protein